MPTTSNWAWVTTMRSHPSSRAAAIRASASSGEACPVCTTSRCAAQTFSTARAAGSTCAALVHHSDARGPDAAPARRATWLSASKVGNHTTRP